MTTPNMLSRFAGAIGEAGRFTQPSPTTTPSAPAPPASAVADAASAAAESAAGAIGGLFGAVRPPARAGAGLLDVAIPGLGDRFPGGRPGIIPPVAPPVAPPVEGPPADATAMQRARWAIEELRRTSVEEVREAIATLRAKNAPAPSLLDWMERRTRVTEVINVPAARWTPATVGDFASLFQMEESKARIMDEIVAIGILNDPQLAERLRAEAAPAPSGDDMLQRRRVVYQYPPAGTRLEPPYVVLVAVEHQDTRGAEDAVAAIMGQLVDFQGYRLPRDVAARLG